MIYLTRPDGQLFALNCDLLKFVEHTPETVVTLVTGERIEVRETTQKVLDLVLDFRRSIVAHLSLGARLATYGTPLPASGDRKSLS
jgi:flagellar protein FlbD